MVVLAVAALLLSSRGPATDLPERVVAAATNRLPAYRRGWGDALVAELTAVQGRGRRWRFAAGVLRVALVPPVPQPTKARTIAIVGVVGTVAVTLAAVWLLPAHSVFVAALGLLTSYTIAIAYRWRRFPTSLANRAVGAMAVIGVVSAIGAVIAVAATHPAATRDPTHVFS